MVRQLRSAHIVQRTIPLPEGREWFYELKFDWERNIPQLTMNTGERYQYFKVPRRLAIELFDLCSIDRVEWLPIWACARKSTDYLGLQTWPEEPHSATRHIEFPRIPQMTFGSLSSRRTSTG